MGYHYPHKENKMVSKKTQKDINWLVKNHVSGSLETLSTVLDKSRNTTWQNVLSRFNSLPESKNDQDWDDPSNFRSPVLSELDELLSKEAESCGQDIGFFRTAVDKYLSKNAKELGVPQELINSLPEMVKEILTNSLAITAFAKLSKEVQQLKETVKEDAYEASIEEFMKNWSLEEVKKHARPNGRPQPVFINEYGKEWVPVRTSNERIFVRREEYVNNSMDGEGTGEFYNVYDTRAVSTGGYYNTVLTKEIPSGDYWELMNGIKSLLTKAVNHAGKQVTAKVEEQVAQVLEERLSSIFSAKKINDTTAKLPKAERKKAQDATEISSEWLYSRFVPDFVGDVLTKCKPSKQSEEASQNVTYLEEIIQGAKRKAFDWSSLENEDTLSREVIINISDGVRKVYTSLDEGKEFGGIKSSLIKETLEKAYDGNVKPSGSKISTDLMKSLLLLKSYLSAKEQLVAEVKEDESQLAQLKEKLSGWYVLAEAAMNDAANYVFCKSKNGDFDQMMQFNYFFDNNICTEGPGFSEGNRYDRETDTRLARRILWHVAHDQRRASAQDIQKYANAVLDARIAKFAPKVTKLVDIKDAGVKRDAERKTRVSEVASEAISSCYQTTLQDYIYFKGESA